jgi:hypothetical protein
MMCMYHRKLLPLWKNKREDLYNCCSEFRANLHCKILIIDKYLYGVKTFAARFHEHLSESLLKLSIKKTKHDLDKWMVGKSSNYESLATYLDDILIWIKDPMTVIKSLE